MRTAPYYDPSSARRRIREAWRRRHDPYVRPTLRLAIGNERRRQVAAIQLRR